MSNTSQGAVFGILDRIYQTILKIDDQGSKKKDLIVQMQTLGTPINPKDFNNAWTPFLESGDEGDDAPDEDDPSIEAAYNTATLVDKKLARTANFEQVEGTQKITSTWKAIVDGAQLSSQKSVELSDDQKEDLEDAYDLLWSYELVKGPRAQEDIRNDAGEIVTKKGDRIMEKVPVRSRTYEKYIECKRAYEKAEMKYTDGYADSLYSKISKRRWPMKGKALISAVNDAMDDWNTVGKRNRVEEALNVLGAQGRNPTAGMINDAKNRYKIYQAALAGQFADSVPYSYLSPSNWCEEDADIWTEYNGKFTASETHDYSKTESWHAELKVKFGLFSGGASTSGSTSKVDNNSESEDTEISLKWAAIDINRPWMDTSLLSFGGWYLKLAGSKKGCISNGDPSKLENLPCIPVKMIVVKDVVVKNKAIQDHFDSMSKTVKADANFSYGPFVSGSGGYSSDEEAKNHYKKMAREGIAIPGIQLIGWVSAKTPTAPALDTPTSGNGAIENNSRADVVTA